MRYKSYEEFWPFYVSQHRNPVCRNLHFVGSTGTLVFLALALLRSAWFLLAMVLCGYFFAWLGHFVFERNRPATFTYPLWSLRADFRMYRYMLFGKMSGQVASSRDSRAGQS